MMPAGRQFCSASIPMILSINGRTFHVGAVQLFTIIENTIVSSLHPSRGMI